MATIFLSYSHDSDDHKAWVRKLADDLASRGIDVVLDQRHLRLGQDVAMFMQRAITQADRVLMICSDTYVDKAERGVGGVGYERLIVTAEVVGSIDTIKFVPVLRACSSARVPVFLGPRLYVDFRDNDSYADALDLLCSDILASPSVDVDRARPELSGSPPASMSAKRETRRDVAFLDDQWFVDQHTTSMKGLLASRLNASMEVRFGLQDEINRSQLDLLAAVGAAEITTFGWPIAILLQSVPDYAPKPYADGIRAEVSIDPEKSQSGRQSYDYWAARNNGDFQLLQSLFEDSRLSNSIFFNTRIIRVTEALLFAARYYERLGVSPDATVLFRVVHSGLAGRQLTSASTNRMLRPSQPCHAPESVAERAFRLGKVSEELVDHVEGLLAPMFMLFEFRQFAHPVYEDIVRRFEKGECS